MKDILVAGYYGAGNVGDEAILSAMLADLKNVHPGVSYTVLSWNPDRTAKSYNVRSVHWQDISAIVDAARKSDLILVGGGGIFHDYWDLDPKSFLRRNHGGISSYGSLPILAQLLGISCMLYAVGVGPLFSDQAKEYTRLTFERCQIATLRDKHSMQILLETGFTQDENVEPLVKVLADPAFNLIPSSGARDESLRVLSEGGIRDGQPVLGVVLRYWDRPTPPGEWVPEMARGLHRFLDRHRDLQLLLIPFQITDESRYTNDLKVLQTLSQNVGFAHRTHLNRETLDPDITQSMLRACDLVLGMRLHALIMAINERVPAVGLPYDPKVVQMMEEVAMGTYCAPSYSPAADTLVTLLETAWENRNSLPGELSDSSKGMRKKASENADYAHRLLSQPRRAPAQSVLQQFSLRQIELMEDVDVELEKERQQRKAIQKKNQELQAQLSALQKEVELIKSSQTWQLARTLQRVRHFFIPVGSLREKLYFKLLRFFNRDA